MARIAILERSRDTADLEIRDFQPADPEKDEVLVQNVAIGLSVLDDITRSQLIDGFFKKNSIIVGYAGVGSIVSVGGNVKGFVPGQKVVYLTPSAGACATHCCIPAQYIASVPQGIRDKELAAVFMHGMLAHALTTRTFIISHQTNVLVHDIFSIAGQVIAKFAKSRKPSVIIGTVQSEQQLKEALDMGICTHVLLYNSENFVQNVMKITNNIGVHVVYDGVGSDFIMHKSIDVLCMFGMLVLFNESIFRIQNVSVLELAKKSLYLSVPSVFDYKRIREEFVLTVYEIFSMMTNGSLPTNYIEYKMAGLKEALDTISNKKTSDAVIIGT